MRFILGILAVAASVYSLLIFVRIIFSWFGDFVSGKPVEIVKMITDPYLDWWRRKLNLRIGFLDFSPIAAIVFLSFLQNILYTLSISERMYIGSILAEILFSVWTIVSFIIGFFIIIIALRMIAYLTNRNIYSPFWGVIDNVSQPIMYRMNRIIFGNKIGGYLKGVIISLIILIVLMAAGWIIVNILANLLYKLPI